VRSRFVVAWLVCVGGVGATGVAEAGRCGDGAPPKVFVKAKTPLRKGPGLNYQVSSFLERGECLKFSEVSLDKQWVLIDAGETLGWVPMGRLEPESQALARAGAPAAGAVGSSQSRGMARVIKQTILLAGPQKKAEPMRVLPVDIMVVPIATTADGEWIQVRDERGQVGWVLASEVRGDALADLPVDQEVSAQVAAELEAPLPPRLVHTRPGRSGAGVAVTAAVFGGALVPTHSLDTDAPAGRRRYDLTAVSPSTGVELEFMDLGPLSGRLAYTTSFIFGVDAGVGASAGGNQHDLYARAGLPVPLGPVTVTPELGYHFGMFDFDSVLADAPRNVTLLSTTTHAGTLGARATWFVTPYFMLEADVGGMVGGTSAGPRKLGASGGLAAGGYGAVGGQYFFGDFVGLMFRYSANIHRASWSQADELEPATRLDPAITEGSLTDITHGLMAGLSFLLAG
jgi:SH3-like domain-containing protein